MKQVSVCFFSFVSFLFLYQPIHFLSCFFNSVFVFFLVSLSACSFLFLFLYQPIRLLSCFFISLFASSFFTYLFIILFVCYLVSLLACSCVFSRRKKNKQKNSILTLRRNYRAIPLTANRSAGVGRTINLTGFSFLLFSFFIFSNNYKSDAGSVTPSMKPVMLM